MLSPTRAYSSVKVNIAVGLTEWIQGAFEK